MHEDAIKATYLTVVEELQRSEFAQRRGIRIAPMPYHLDELAAVMARMPATGRFLDIGTGMGVVPETVLRLGHSVVTVDLDRNEAGRECLNRLMEAGADGHFAVVGQEDIPTPDASVDVAFAGDVIEHLPGTPRHFLREIYRTLKPGGHIVLTTPNAMRLTVRLRVALGHSNWPPVEQYIEDPPTPAYHIGHHHEYTDNELSYVLADAGFDTPNVRFVENTLKHSGMLRSFADIKTQDRSSASYWSGRQHFCPMEIARVGLLWLVKIAPRLRSIMLATARKPD